MPARKAEPVRFEVEFADGSTAPMAILRSGDHVAHLIAAERKKAKLLPNKPIYSPLGRSMEGIDERFALVTANPPPGAEVSILAVQLIHPCSHFSKAIFTINR